MTPDVRHHTLRIRKETGQPMQQCYWSARRHVHFMATLKADIAASKKRARAARKGWKTRRARVA